MPWKHRKRWPPTPSEFRRIVALVASEVSASTVTDVFRLVRRRCPDWAVTPHRVRKALKLLADSKKKSDSQSRSSSRTSNDSIKVYPQDVVELRAQASRGRHAQWQWRGQVLRVAGYDDGETEDDEEQELPPGCCSVFWLGCGLEQWPNALTKVTSLRVLDRPWLLGDRVAKIEDPRSLGTVVGVNSRFVFAGLSKMCTQPLEVSPCSLRAVGGFRAEDWVASTSSQWIGRVEEAVFRVEVEVCRKNEQRLLRGKGRKKPPICVFQVSSEGLPGLEPAGSEDVTPQELCPHFPGQKVRAAARLWRQAEWTNRPSDREPRRAASLTGLVTAVQCELLAVRWLAGAVKDSQPPDEWVSPDSVKLIPLPNSEGWAVGEHVQASSSRGHSPTAIISESRTSINVLWADGILEEDVCSMKLCPRPHISAHDFLPHDFVTRNIDDAVNDGLSTPHEDDNTACGPVMNTVDNFTNHFWSYGDTSHEVPSMESEILPSMETGLLTQVQVQPRLGVVQSVDLKARTAVVQWVATMDREEVSVFELTEHPQIDVRLGDAVLVLDDNSQEDGVWAGRVHGLRGDGKALVQLLRGTSEWIDVRRLLVVDDVEEEEEDSEGDSEDEEEDTEVGDVRTSIRLLTEEDEEDEVDSDHNDGIDDELHDVRSRICSEGDRDTSMADVQVLEQVGGSSSSTATPSQVSILTFDVCDEDIDPTDHHFLSQASTASRAFMMSVRREMAILKKGLLEDPGGLDIAPIIVRTFSSRSDLFRAMVVGPPDTPYASVPFFFDLALPAEYPREPPQAYFHAHYVGNERLNPNLYIDGKVCLSLLGTWSGPSWDAQKSTLLQVLVSLQGLVLVEEPYFNEPGHECDVGTEHGRQASTLYNEHARLLALRCAVNAAQNPPLGFAEIVAAYFTRAGPMLLQECEQALSEPSSSRTSEGFRKVLAKTILPRLRECWGSDSVSTGGRASGTS